MTRPPDDPATPLLPFARDLMAAMCVSASTSLDITHILLLLDSTNSSSFLMSPSSTPLTIWLLIVLTETLIRRKF